MSSSFESTKPIPSDRMLLLWCAAEASTKSAQTFLSLIFAVLPLNGLIGGFVHLLLLYSYRQQIHLGNSFIRSCTLSRMTSRAFGLSVFLFFSCLNIRSDFSEIYAAHMHSKIAILHIMYYNIIKIHIS